ncbi:MAG: hypothetical protein IT463_03765 [Planctomycetes bacterium]|nr:hypothetical protein [Planctomycetota bacterium]
MTGPVCIFLLELAAPPLRHRGVTYPATIGKALRAARRRWFVAAVVNIGGRWAVLPALGACLAGLAAALLNAGVLWGIACSILGALGVLAALIATATAHNRSGSRGAPDWVLPLELSLGLPGAVASYMEGAGPFHGALEGRIAAALQQKRAAPAYALRFSSLVVALFLCALPVALALAPEIAPPAGSPRDTVAAQRPSQPDTPQPQPAEAAADVGGQGQGGSDQGNPQDNGKTGQSDAGTQGAAGASQPPQDRQPAPANGNPPPSQPEDQAGQPPPTKPPVPEEDVNTNDLRVLPEAGEGETRREQRSRWRYNPNGQDAGTPRVAPSPTAAAPETATARQRVTTREKRVLEELAKRLAE